MAYREWSHARRTVVFAGLVLSSVREYKSSPDRKHFKENDETQKKDHFISVRYQEHTGHDDGHQTHLLFQDCIFYAVLGRYRRYETLVYTMNIPNTYTTLEMGTSHSMF